MDISPVTAPSRQGRRAVLRHRVLPSRQHNDGLSPGPRTSGSGHATTRSTTRSTRSAGACGVTSSSSPSPSRRGPPPPPGVLLLLLLTNGVINLPKIDLSGKKIHGISTLAGHSLSPQGSPLPGESESTGLGGADRNPSATRGSLPESLSGTVPHFTTSLPSPETQPSLRPPATRGTGPSTNRVYF